MTVNPEQPGAGEPYGIREIARARRNKADDLRSVHTAVTNAKSTVTGSVWAGQSQVAFVNAMDTVTPDILLLAGGLEAEASALDTYAGQVQMLKDEQKRLEVLRASARQHLRALTAQWNAAFRDTDRTNVADADAQRQANRLSTSIGDTQSHLNAIQRQWDELVQRRRNVDLVCVSVLSSASVLGATAKFAAGGMAGKSPDQVLQMLTGLTAADLKALLAAHPELKRLIANADPTAVAAWWNSMNSGTPGQPSLSQAALIAGMPSVIGNLNGVAYWARTMANIASLKDQIAAQERAATPNKDRLAALEAVRSAVRNGLNENPPRELISLSSSGFPMAALAVGDLDNASVVTYVVPGMGTEVATNMVGYTSAAQQLAYQQKYVGGVIPGGYAVVAWLNYQPPGATDVVGVMSNELAVSGAKRLVNDMNGFYATRAAGSADVQTSIVAHSYGTDVAAIALTSTHADHAVLLGSAGIDTAIRGASELNVLAGQVFATQAHHDGFAPTGQAISGRTDPTIPSWGAHDFNSEFGEDSRGNKLQAVTQHGPLAPTGPPGAYSYLDNRTTAQYNTARITVGQGANLPVADTPTDRLGLQMQDRVNDWAKAKWW